MEEQQGQREHYQKSLLQYEQELSAAMLRQFPLQERDRQLLKHLQQALQLREEDVSAVQTKLLGQTTRQQPAAAPQAEVLGASSPLPSSSPANPDPAATAFSNPDVLPAQPLPAQSSSLDGTLPPNLIQNVSYRSLESPVSPEVGVGTPNPMPIASTPSSDAAVTEHPINPSPQPPMPPTKESKSRSSYTPLVILGIMVAALIGSLAALWSSTNLPNLFGRNNSTTDVTPVNSSQSNQAADLINLGVTAQGIGDTGTAIKYANEAIDLLSKGCPENAASNQVGASTKTDTCQYLARAYSNRSHAYFSQQNYGRALDDASRAAKLAPSLAEARINLANARFKRGDRTAALQDYEKALNLNSTQKFRAAIYNNRGNILLAEGQTQPALKDYNEAIKLNPKYADAYYNRGLAREKLNDPVNAINDFQTAAQFYRNDKAFTLAEQAEKKATALQQKAPQQNQTPAA